MKWMKVPRARHVMQPGFSGEWRLAMLAALVVLSVLRAYASVKVYPTEIFVVPPNHSAPVTVSNQTDSTVEVWVSFTYGYPVSFDTGKVVMYLTDSAAAGEPSAITWLRAIPQRFTLRAQESQVVRLFGVPPPGTMTGEYWARVIVSSKPKNRPVVVTRGTRVNMELVTQTSLPFHFRTGAVTSGISVKESQAVIDDGFMRLHLKLQRMGNASFWGRVSTRLLNSSGKLVQSREYKLVVYKELDYTVLDTLPSVYAGPYTLELLFDNKHPSLSSQYWTKSEPFLQRLPVTVR